MTRGSLAELRACMGFTEADASILARLHPLLAVHFEAIADDFCGLIRTYEGVPAVIRDEAQGLQGSLKAWLGELLGGPHDDAYAERRAHAGHTLVRVGLELRYMIAAMGHIRDALQRVATNAWPHDVDTGRAAHIAVTRVCDLDLAIMVESYKDDRIEGARTKGAIETSGAPVDETARWRSPRWQQPFTDAWRAADVVVLGFDAVARLIVANRKAETLTGYAFDALADSNVFALLFGDRGASVRTLWFEARDGRPVEMEADLRTRGGKSRTMRWHAAMHRADAEGAGSIVVVGLDLTGERELERSARWNERLATTGTLAAGLAREIRNPLNGANLHLSVLDRALARSPGVPPEAREATRVLHAEIQRLSALVTDFLEVARPRPLAAVDIDANEVARSLGSLTREAERQGKALSIEPSPLPVVVKLDVDRVKQALSSLVRNGLDAVAPGGRVVVRVRGSARHVEIDVIDDGCGVPDPSAAIFDAFYTTKERGTGLGLSIVQRVVADHGGEVRFESRRGSTVFTVRLPVRPTL